MLQLRCTVAPDRVRVSELFPSTTSEGYTARISSATSAAPLLADETRSLSLAGKMNRCVTTEPGTYNEMPSLLYLVGVREGSGLERIPWVQPSGCRL